MTINNMPLPMYSRLSVMMLLQYGVWGAWMVTLGTWLGQTQGFSGQQIAWAAGATAIGAIVSPFFVGLVADKHFATQKLLGVLHGIGAVLLFIATTQTSFTPFYLILLLYAICYMPTLALTNALAFRQMQDPNLQFGAVRVFGTLGWIVASFVIGKLAIEDTAIPMQIAASCSLVLAVYCFTLPHTPPLAQSEKFSLAQIIPKEALQLLCNRSMAVFVLASFLICIPLQFYYAFANLFFNEIDVAEAATKMSFGQMSEVFFMLLIPFFFKRLGVKAMLAIGMLAWVARYVLFAYGDSDTLMWMLLTGILLHGICYDFFFVVGQLYIDRESPKELRAATQGIITLITYGAGMLAGSWLSGLIVDHYVTDAGHNWNTIWLFAAGFAAAVLVLFLLAFSDKKSPGNNPSSAINAKPLEEAA